MNFKKLTAAVAVLAMSASMFAVSASAESAPTSISVSTESGWTMSDVTAGKDTVDLREDGMTLTTTEGDGYIKIQYDITGLDYKAEDYPAYMISFDYKADIKAKTTTAEDGTVSEAQNTWGFYYLLKAGSSAGTTIANNWKLIRNFTGDVTTTTEENPNGWISYHSVHNCSVDTDKIQLQILLRDMNNGGTVDIKNIRITPMTSTTTYDSDYFVFTGDGSYSTVTANATKTTIAWKGNSDGGYAYESSTATVDSDEKELSPTIQLNGGSVYLQVTGVDKDVVINSITLK
ncbi:MAG: hypothetical protein ACI4EA_10650 [Candidatus Ornithomonoglobus sp.]